MGPRFGVDKARLGEVAELTIHPGLAGLHVVESFASATPMITANISYHSHEIDYLRPGVDSIMLDSEASSQALAAEAVHLFNTPSRLEGLQQACVDSAARFSLDQMVDRFRAGIVQALDKTGTR